MLFVFGISNGEKKLNFIQTMLCSRCGQFGRLEAYVTYMYFSLFFIPLFRWNRRYYVKSTCCNTVYQIDTEIGKRMQRGENLVLKEEDLKVVNQTGYHYGSSCPACGYPVSGEFDYCPKCGRRLH